MSTCAFNAFNQLASLEKVNVYDNQSTESADSKGLSNNQEIPEGSWRPPLNDISINVLSVLLLKYKTEFNIHDPP